MEGRGSPEPQVWMGVQGPRGNVESKGYQEQGQESVAPRGMRVNLALLESQGIEVLEVPLALKDPKE